ncbi:hypothetical protein [Streptomyces canus]|uniref:hypothetical protein n=1 Tax=Streptomyces canus TaxID=58343 RepID=UPI0036E79D88
MTGTSGQRTVRARGLIVDEPALDEVLSVAVEHRLDGQEAGADDSVHVLGGLVTTEDTRGVRRAGVAGRLTAEAYDLLGLLSAHPHQILSGHLVEVCLSNLRRKVVRDRAPVIHAGRGLGSAIRAAEEGR